MLTVRGQQHSFSTHERMFLWKCQSFWERRCFDLRGTPNLLIHAECSNHLGYQGQTICCLMFLNTDSGGMDIFEVKLTFEMLTVRWQQNSFSTHERMFLWKCQIFWDRKCLDLRGNRTTTFGFMLSTPTIWAIRVRHVLSHIFEYWLWRYRYMHFWSKVNIWNVNCAQATAFFHVSVTMRQPWHNWVNRSYDLPMT